MHINQEQLKSQLHYCENTGEFTWIVPKQGQSRKNAGYKRKDGYIKIVVNQSRYLAHRLAWLYVYGYLPNLLDHMNGNPSDNRICNLREATISENGFNRPIQNNNKSGFKGVYWNKSKSKWMARIGVKGKMIYLGLFDDVKDAAESYKKAAINLQGNFLNMNGIVNE